MHQGLLIYRAEKSLLDFNQENSERLKQGRSNESLQQGSCTPGNRRSTKSRKSKISTFEEK